MNLVMVEGITTMVGGDITEAEEMIINQNGDINQVLVQGQREEEEVKEFALDFVQALVMEEVVVVVAEVNNDPQRQTFSYN